MNFPLQQFQKQFIARIEALDEETLTTGLGAFLSELWDEFDFSLSSPPFGRLSSDDGLTGALNRRWAQVYDAPAARIGVSGSSGSNLAIVGFLLPALGAGRDMVLCERHAHKSLFGGVIASGMQALILENAFDPNLGIPLPASAQHVDDMLSTHRDRVGAVCITSPTYEGLIADLPELSAVCRQYDTLLIVDGAWGSSFGLFAGYPPSPIEFADIAVVSPHKSGFAPSQVSLVLFGSEALALEYDRICDIGLATSSPNQLLLAIADYRYSLARTAHAAESWHAVSLTAQRLRDSLPQRVEGVEAVTPASAGHNVSPVQVCFSTRKSGLSALDWAKRLTNLHAIDPEYASEDLLVLLLGARQAGQEDLLIEALVSAAPAVPPSGQRTIDMHPPVRPAAFTGPVDLRTAFFQSPAKRGENGRSSEFVATYPPGRPKLLPGERIHSRVPFGDLELRCVRPECATHQQLEAYAHFFSEIFSNPPFNQFAFHTDEPLVPIPASRFTMNLSSETDYIDGAGLRNIVLEEPFQRWIDPDTCQSVIRDRCQDAGTLIFALDKERLVGVLHARAASLRRIYQTEEWRDPLLFSRARGKHLADDAAFEAKAAHHFGLGWKDPVMTVSCMAVRPSHRGSLRLLYEMFAASARLMAPDLAKLPILAEVPDDGAARVIDMAINERLVHGVLANGHSVVFSQEADRVLEIFRSGYGHFCSHVRDEVRAMRALWRPSLTDHPSVSARDTGERGMGVFADRPIKAGERIAVFEGETYQAGRASALPARIVNHAIQTGPQRYVSNEGGLAELINHSCAPNAGIKGLVDVVAIRDIRAGEEVTWDYRCSENSDWVLERCLCGQPGCSGKIEGFSSLSPERRAFYVKQGAVSDWLMRPSGALF